MGNWTFFFGVSNCNIDAKRNAPPYSIFAMNNFVFEYVITHITGRGGAEVKIRRHMGTWPNDVAGAFCSREEIVDTNYLN